LPKQLCKKILDNTFDYKKDEKTIKNIFEFIKKQSYHGGPLTKKQYEKMPNQ